MMILALLALPTAAAVLALVVPPRIAERTNVLAGVAAVAVAGVLAHDVVVRGASPAAIYGYLRADGLAALVALGVAIAGGVGAAIGSRSFTPPQPRAVRAYLILSPLLTTALLVAALADDLGILWISLELAAVLSAFLIGSGPGRARHDAAFKYMLLGSAGLVFGLLATAIVHYAAVPALGHGEAALSYRQLLAAGPALPADTMRIALALAAAGYGLKVGLFPLHVWKPDAYAAAPGAVSAVLAGAAVLVPLEAMIRFGTLCSAAGEADFTGKLFVAAGVISMVAALLLVVRERDLRRILAFTSVEQLGLVLLAIGLGPDAARGGLLHLVANCVLKALAFGVLGLIVVQRGSADSQSGPGLYRRSFALTAVFLVVIAAGLGFPPFGMFTSELMILQAAFAGGHHGVALVVAVVLAAIFGLVAAATIRMLFARSDDAPAPAVDHGRAAVLIGVPVLAAAAWLGVGISPALWETLGALAARIAP